MDVNYSKRCFAYDQAKFTPGPGCNLTVEVVPSGVGADNGLGQRAPGAGGGHVKF